MEYRHKLALHSIVVLLKGTRVIDFEERDRFTFYCSSLKVKVINEQILGSHSIVVH